MLKWGLLGHPLSHSFSAGLFSCLNRRFNLEASYENFDIPADRVGEFFHFALKNLDGFNITVPYKLKPFEFPDIFTFDAAALIIGAINTVRVDGSKLMGYNTDFIGFIKPIKKRRFKTVLVFGAGGAARAVIYALHNKKVMIFNRTRKHAEEIARQFNNTAVVENISKALRDADLVVNATSVGLHGEEFYLLRGIKVGDLSGKLFYDLIYNPPITDFLKFGIEHGAEPLNGFKMLLYQAIENIKIWTGKNLEMEVFECSKFLQPVNRMANTL